MIFNSCYLSSINLFSFYSIIIFVIILLQIFILFYPFITSFIHFVELIYFFNDNKEKKNVSVSYKASFCGSPPPTKLLSNQLTYKGYWVLFFLFCIWWAIELFKQLTTQLYNINYLYTLFNSPKSRRNGQLLIGQQTLLQ
jgi:hypothetical protein